MLWYLPILFIVSVNYINMYYCMYPIITEEHLFINLKGIQIKSFNLLAVIYGL